MALSPQAAPLPTGPIKAFYEWREAAKTTTATTSSDSTPAPTEVIKLNKTFFLNSVQLKLFAF